MSSPLQRPRALFDIETLALAAIGLFSLLAYSVRVRTAERAARIQPTDAFWHE